MWRDDLVTHSRPPTLVGAVFGFIFSPGFRVISTWRFSKAASNKNVLCRLFGRLAHIMFVEGAGCYISTDACLGARLHFPHPVGIVIGEGVKVGDGCTIYQCTTLGRNKMTDRSYPAVGDNVILYAGAVVIGEVNLGNGSVVGANSVVLRDVPAGSAAVGSPARIIVTEAPPKR
ncbi:hypothetical protein IVB28_25845 [Bradyrhizobium sp. 199]|nr:hypothetical protein [Bradyrhizobium sp. 199]